jgi:hydrogenase maturation protease
MKMDCVDQIAKAILYEGYLLYPYRPSSVKNQQRFNFGVLYPPDYAKAQDGNDACSLHTECLVRGNPSALVEVKVRFLHLQTRAAAAGTDGAGTAGRQEAMEQELYLSPRTLDVLCSEGATIAFAFPSQKEAEAPGLEGPLEVRCRHAIYAELQASASKLDQHLFKLEVTVRNVTPCKIAGATRDRALLDSMISTHVVFGALGGEFVSLLEPPDSLKDAAAGCQNTGVWPVLVGDPQRRDLMLASPIILYDHPQIAPESSGDLFDGTEIDEILSLRIMTLTDEEKQEIRAGDERARAILERTESMPAEQFMKLHGAVRGLRPLNKEAT